MKLKLPYNRIITEEIQTVLHQAHKQWPPSVHFDHYFKRLAEYSVRGKMVRSNLLLMSWQGYQSRARPPSKAAITMAAIQELSESALLMQDDVLDADELRRGQPTLHRQYQSLALDQKQDVTAEAAKNFGEAWALMLGDVIFFYIFWLLTQLSVDQKTKLALIRLYSHELIITGSGQLGDLAAGFGIIKPSRAEVQQISLQKTAHYTICLPLLAGATLANQSSAELRKLTKLGETIGELFQLTDDRLDLFSDATISGKSQGSDVRTGKQTLLYFLTNEKLEKQLKKHAEFLQLYGKSAITEQELVRVQSLVKESGAYQAHELEINRLADQAADQLSRLAITTTSRNQLLQLLDWFVQRNH